MNPINKIGYQDSEHRPFTVLNAEADNPWLIIADHASNSIPARYGNLGLASAHLNEHIAIDIGTADLTRYLSEALDCRAVLCGTSRLVVDCNRIPFTETWAPEESDGVVIPGNASLDEGELQLRYREYFRPYHDEIERHLAHFAAAHLKPFIISLHSFTPAMDGRNRPWEVGVLHDEDYRVAPRLIDNLRSDPDDFLVGDNEPYSGTSPLGFALKIYGKEYGLPYAVFEVRQDLLGDDAGIKLWSDRLARALLPVISDPSVHE